LNDAPAFPRLDSAELPADAIEVARIGEAWGIKGWFKIIPFSAQPEALFSSKRWYLQPPDRGPKPFSGTVLLPIKEAKDHSGSVVACSHDIQDRTAAEALKGARVWVARSSFPSAAPDEYYWVDLIGLSVVNREGLDLGVVTDLLSTGPQTVLVIQYPGPEGKTLERMVPFVSAYIDQVELPQKLIRVDWQPEY
jgi:16S rRNA processing protein RimM